MIYPSFSVLSYPEEFSQTPCYNHGTALDYSRSYKRVNLCNTKKLKSKNLQNVWIPSSASLIVLITISGQTSQQPVQRHHNVCLYVATAVGGNMIRGGSFY